MWLLHLKCIRDIHFGDFCLHSKVAQIEAANFLEIEVHKPNSYTTKQGSSNKAGQKKWDRVLPPGNILKAASFRTPEAASATKAINWRLHWSFSFYCGMNVYRNLYTGGIIGIIAACKGDAIALQSAPSKPHTLPGINTYAATSRIMKNLSSRAVYVR